MNRKIYFTLLIATTAIGLALLFFPYFFTPDTVTVTQVPWSETGYETPKATIQFTFTSKIAFTTNYPIHAKVEIWFHREDQNDTNIIAQVVNPPAQAFKHPINNLPTAGLIEISQTGQPRKGELDLEFVSSGAYGFAIYSGESSYLGNMTVGYAAQDKEVIQISPPETRFQIEWIIRGIGVTLIPIPAILTLYKKLNDESKETPMFILQRFQETVEKPVKSKWSIRILHPNKTIEKCIVLYNENKLPWWDVDKPYYEKTIEASSGGIVRIPIDLEKPNAEIKILDGKKRLRKEKFEEIIRSQYEKAPQSFPVIKGKIVQELKHLLKKIRANLHNETFGNLNYDLSVFYENEAELQRKLTSKTFEIVKNAYSHIRELNQEIGKATEWKRKDYEETILLVRKALKELEKP